MSVRRLRGAPAAIATALLAASLTLSACGGTTSASGPAVTEIVLGQVTEPANSPDPVMDGSLAGYSYYYNLYDSLTVLDNDGKITPRLATEWKSSDDLKTWTFTVRTGVTFHNGDPLTAADVAYTYQTILANPESGPRSYMQPLKSVEATDDTTVVFHLKTPFSPFPSVTTSVSIVPKEVYAELGSEEFAKAPVGSGPYRFESWTKGVSYVMVRNDDYWGPRPPLDKITFQTVADEDARLNGVLSGSLDLALIAPNQVDSLAGNPDVRAESMESNGVTFLGLNATAGPLQDEKVRRALALAIDKEALASGVLSGRAAARAQLIAPRVAGFDPSVERNVHDLEQAKALIAESGYSGEPIPFEYAVDGRIPLSEEIAQAIQGMAAEAGITLDLKGMDQATLSSRIYSTEDMAGVYLNTYAPSQMDGDPVIEDMFAGGSNDYAELDETNALVLKTRETSAQERIDTYGELMELNLERALLIPLYTPETNYVVDAGLAWQPRADGLFFFGGTAQ
ncbi:ABC transporter substrate-binding protein [Microlunatus sp. GCM10028923]|uniref:ABC transporter substrate-binding protein n=1 Tax=Microlunatus sp. GCM10028923 TaxID=3273400 RepID=UPI0036076848